ncbi:MAG: hypothetical protein ACYTDX_03870 [Planctomycetota bacterium]|jgi:hypothetical protein
MTLSALRHLVLAGNFVAIAAAGGAGWYAYTLDVEIRDPKEWKKALPATGTSKADRQDGPGGIQGYNKAIDWPMGARPVKEEVKVDKTPKKVVDPFKTSYDLRVAMVCADDPFRSWVLLQDKSKRSFRVGMGSYVLKDPWGTEGPRGERTAWRLDRVWIEAEPGAKLGERKENHLALFINDETEDTQQFEMDLSSGGFLSEGFDGLELKDIKVPFAEKPFAGRLIKKDLEAANPVIEWELPEDEAEWLVTYSDEEAKKLGFGESNTDDDGDGKPDGFVVKSLAPDSRAARLGMKAEDRVISVNDQKVDSNEQAIDVGKRDYDAGRSSFRVQIDRQGKIMNFTFHAKKGKGKKAGKGGRRSNR